jgi:hypothetical protein
MLVRKGVPVVWEYLSATMSPAFTATVGVVALQVYAAGRATAAVGGVVQVKLEATLLTTSVTVVVVPVSAVALWRLLTRIKLNVQAPLIKVPLHAVRDTK